jgi:hypothetical protein
MNRKVSTSKIPARQIACLTEMSAGVLVACAAGVSALLWLAILAVL